MNPAIRKLRVDAERAFDERRWSQALAMFSDLEKLEPAEPRWSRRVADIYKEMGSRHTKSLVNALARAADKHSRKGELVKSIALCKQILTLEPDHLQTQSRLAALHAAMALQAAEEKGSAAELPPIPGAPGRPNPASAVARAKAAFAEGPAPPPPPRLPVSHLAPPIDPGQIAFAAAASPGTAQASAPADRRSASGSARQGAPAPNGHAAKGLPGPPSAARPLPGPPLAAAPAPGGPGNASATPLAAGSTPHGSIAPGAGAAPPGGFVPGTPTGAGGGFVPGTPAGAGAAGPGAFVPGGLPAPGAAGPGTPATPVGLAGAAASSPAPGQSIGGQQIPVPSPQAFQGPLPLPAAAPAALAVGPAAPGSETESLTALNLHESIAGSRLHEAAQVPSATGSLPRVYEIPLGAGALQTVDLPGQPLAPQPTVVSLGELPPARSDANLRAQALLPEVPMFSNLTPESLLRLLSGARLLELPRGQILFRQGEPGDAMYVVADGKVGVFVEGSPPVQLSTLGEGAVIGEIAVITRQPRGATVAAVEDARLISIDRALVAEVVRGEPRALQHILGFVTQRLLDKVLRSSPLFRTLPRPEARALIRRFRLLEVEPKASLLVEGTQAAGLYVVAAGQLSVMRGAGGPNQISLATLETGSFCGEISLLTRGPATATVRARIKSLILELARSEFYEVLALYPTMRGILEQIAESRRQANAATLQLLGMP